ncbi:PD-(D/E)XK nuclease family protein [Aquipuribacter nitratireducens]|uniref:DNA 3'-5' helicase n=1 Tax=Aquipuribacter nitratireducens TaxID=650104 RepID=A0ABW0GLC1_9MICO
MPALPGAPPRALTADQAGLVAARGRQVVLGGAATGRTTALLAWARARLRDHGPQPLVLVPSRRAAGVVRDALEQGVGTSTRGPLARTPQSLAWALLREHAQRTGAPAPRLVTAGELDEVLADLLAGHTDRPGDGLSPVPGPRWPAGLDAAVRGSRRFRDEVRELSARLVEHGHDAAGLARLARAHGRAEWAAAARLLAEVDRVRALRGDGGLDPAATVTAAADLLADPATGLGEAVRASVAHVGVDDAHDLTPAGWSLVRELADLVDDVCVVGDPDATTQAFRGAVPAVLPRVARWLSGPGAPCREARLVTRLGAARAPGRVVDAVVEQLRTGTPAGRPLRVVDPCAATAPPGSAAERPGAVHVAVCLDAADEGHVVAAHLRAARQRTAAPLSWSDMAVVVRGGEQVARLRRALAADDVPVHVPGAATALRDEPVVAVLLEAGEVATDPALLQPDVLERLALGPLVGIDPVRWRRLVRHARTRAAASAGRAVSSQEALAHVCEAVRTRLPAGPGGDDPTVWLPPAVAAPLDRLVRVLRRGAVGAREGAELCLWEVWQAWGAAERWRRRALDGGPGAERADADLDAVVALFDAAAAWADAHPRGDVPAFARHLRGRGVGDDRLLPSRHPDAVTVTTPAGAVGLRWPLVVVAGVQDGAWPDPRLRGSLLGLTDLRAVLAGQEPPAPGGTARHAELRRQARRAVVLDELRLFHVAVSRAAEELVVTAVDDATTRPSDLVELVRRAAGTAPGAGTGAASPEVEPAAGLRPAALVARLRRRLLEADVDDTERAEVARSLARLAAAGVRGADPAEWAWVHDPGHAAHPAAGSGPGRDDAVLVSPSSVGRFLTCPLAWYLDGVGARRASETAQGLGTLVHLALEQVPDGDLERMQAVVDAGWDDLELGDGWVSAHQRTRARGMLERVSRWVAEQRAAGVEVVASEHQVDVLLELPEAGRVRVRGTVDRVERLPDGSVRVVDLKTGSSAVSVQAAAEDPQLELYQLALSEGADRPGPSGGALLLYVGTGTAKAAERVQPRLDDERREAALDRLAGVAAGMGAGRWPATPGERCRTCAVAASCPAVAQGRRLPPPVAPVRGAGDVRE